MSSNTNESLGAHGGQCDSGQAHDEPRVPVLWMVCRCNMGMGNDVYLKVWLVASEFLVASHFVGGVHRIAPHRVCIALVGPALPARETETRKR